MEWIESLASAIADPPPNKPYLIVSPWPACARAHTTTVVDLGGSTLRVAAVNESGRVTHSHTERVQARAEPLEWLAQRISALVRGPFALCWAFPLRDGRLCPMGKGWDLGADLGQPLVQRLNQLLTGDAVCTAAVHDGVASLIAEHSANPACKISLTWGTGINIAFKAGQTVVNTEIGMAASPPYGKALPRRPYDDLLAQQLLPGTKMPFEYMTGGAYLGRLYSLATGTQTETSDLWALLDTDEVAAEIVGRACYLVAAALHAVARVVPGGCAVAYTGGVIFEPAVFSRLRGYLAELAPAHIILVPQKYGPEVGAALVGGACELTRTHTPPTCRGKETQQNAAAFEI